MGHFFPPKVDRHYQAGAQRCRELQHQKCKWVSTLYILISSAGRLWLWPLPSCISNTSGLAWFHSWSYFPWFSCFFCMNCTHVYYSCFYCILMKMENSSQKLTFLVTRKITRKSKWQTLKICAALMAELFLV